MGEKKMKKLCKLVKKENHLERLGKYIKLVKNPNHICLKCGRVAAREEVLCKPMKM